MPGLEVPQGVASNPIQLTVSIATKLVLNVTRDVNSTRHVVEGWLRRNGTGAAVSGKPITISVNDTRYGFTTDQCGYFVLDRDFPPVEDQNTTYTITALFEGDQPVNATAWAKTMDGQSFAACTTTQFGYKPAANSTSIRVEPPVTEKTVPTKSPEEVQEEAEDSGWFRTDHEFSWWFPWYRMHFVLNVQLPPYGTLRIDYGWSALPFGLTLKVNDVFGRLFNDVAVNFVENYIVSTIAATIIKHVAAGIAGRTIAGIGCAIGMYLFFTLTQMLIEYAIFGNDAKTWLVCFISSAIACFMDLITKFLDVVSFLTAIGRKIVNAITHTLNSMWARGLNFFDITGILFNFIDYAIMVYYLQLYKASAE